MKKIIAVLLAAVMLISCTVQASAYTPEEMQRSLRSWMILNVAVPETDEQSSNVDWTVMALSRGGVFNKNEDYKTYVARAVAANANSLYLSDSARFVLAAGAVGLDVRDIGGIDLIKKIEVADLTQEAYTASIAFALMALDSNGFGTDADRQELVDILLDAQRNDGGFNTYLDADDSQSWTVDGEIDATGMTLQALAPYKDDTDCADAIDDALNFIKGSKLNTAGYAAYGSESAESTSQVLIALCCLGINPLSAEYMSGENDILEALSAFVNQDGGGRCWNGSSNVMTSYQIYMAVTAYERYSDGEAGIYDMSCLEILRTQMMYSDFGQALPKITSFSWSVIKFFCGLFRINYFYFN